MTESTTATCIVPNCGSGVRYATCPYCPRHSQQAAKGRMFLIRDCEVCSGPLPSGSSARRRTCSAKCKTTMQNLYRFGLRPHEFRRIYENQDGRCRGCLDWYPIYPTDDSARLYIDHCHVSGKVRGLLCSSCNLAIGKMRDQPEIAERIAKYLAESLEEKPDVRTAHRRKARPTAA